MISSIGLAIGAAVSGWWDKAVAVLETARQMPTTKMSDVSVSSRLCKPASVRCRRLTIRIENL